MTQDDPDLEAAYALETPEDSVRLYREWSTSYDEDFAAAQDYILPAAVAEAFARAGGGGPVLDVGAGTGLLAARLRSLSTEPIDARDISAEMLQVAGGKGLYRATVLGDLTRGLPVADGLYGGVVSSGTFTHGHVGPEALEELLRIARPGALFALSIHQAVYEARGFKRQFEAFGSRIAAFRLEEVPISGAGGSTEHRADHALIALFEKA
ncbi:methyltransferase domain-containing protein [Thioclava sp. BHET1]|nr:methyltransferase domain-containing protein [Thioclava sp. BHET1]